MENNSFNHRVSVIMATFQSEKFLAETLDSICAQTRPIDEIGMMILGKYTLLIKLLDPTSDIPADPTEDEKSSMQACQRIRKSDMDNRLKEFLPTFQISK